MDVKDFEIIRSDILKDVMIFKPSVFRDERGDIFTSYHRDVHDEYLLEGSKFIHDKFATSKKNVVRGLHGDSKTWKLVSCVYGVIYEVVVDMRENSANYLKWDAFELSDKNKLSILIPPGFVNGYCVMSDEALFHYKLAYGGKYIDASEQMTVKWNDPRLNIKWPCLNPIIQERDK